MTRPHRSAAASADLHEVLTRLPAANVILSARPQGFTLGRPAPTTLAGPETLPAMALADPAALPAPMTIVGPGAPTSSMTIVDPGTFPAPMSVVGPGALLTPIDLEALATPTELCPEPAGELPAAVTVTPLPLKRGNGHELPQLILEPRHETGLRDAAPVSAAAIDDVAPATTVPMSAADSGRSAAAGSDPVATAPIGTAPPAAAPISTTPPAAAPISTTPPAAAPISTTPPAAAPVPTALVGTGPTGKGPIGTTPIATAPVATAPPVEPEPLSPEAPPASPDPGHPVPDLPVPVSPAPLSPAPLTPAPISPEPISPAPISPEPISPAPISPAPETPGPLTPAPISPAPGQPAPVSPAPVSPAPDAPDSAGTGLIAEELPSGEALGAEIAAELSAQAQPAPRRPESGEWRGVVLVTGTDTDVGKTIVTAAVAAAAQASGLRVAVIKPGQTGIATGAPTDIEVITRLAAPDTTRTLAEYPEPMAPLAAATVASLPPLELYEVVDAIRAEAGKHDLVLVEGAGGLLVPMGVRPSGDPWTVADLATTLGISAIVVARAGLGTLNHTALTLEALTRRGIPAGVVIGAWPADPELVHWANLSELVPHLIGALPDGAGAMDPGVFRRSAPGWLTPALYGVLDNWRVWAEEFGEGHH